MNVEKSAVLLSDADNLDELRGRPGALSVFDASALPARQRLRAWRAFVSDHLAEADLTYPECVAPHEAFGGHLTVDRRDHVRIGRVHSAHQRLDRTRDHIRRADRETFLLTLVARGTCRIEQGDRTSQIGPGQFCVYDSRRPYRITVPGEVLATIVVVDQSLIEPVKGRRLERTCAQTFDAVDPVGGLVFGFWQQLATRSGTIDEILLNRLVRGGFDLLDAGLPRGDAASPHRVSDLALRRAKLFIADNLDDPNLAPGRIARAAGLSLRRVQEMFQAEATTMTRFVRDLRLAAAAETLANPSMRRATIASIAALHGFGDQSAFNRDFKSRFGAAPGAFRRGRQTVS